MSESAPYHLRGDVVAIHRAIGHYITAFAVVDRSLRVGIAQFFADEGDGLVMEPHPTTPLLDILLDRMTTGRIQSAFLSMSSAIADLNADDKEVRDVLGGMLRHFVSLRNDIAHAYWDVGWADYETGDAVLPTAQVVRVSKEGPSRTVLESLDAKLIGREATRLHTVDRVARTYADSCLQLRTGNTADRPSATLKILTTREPIGRVVMERADPSSGVGDPSLDS
jgi:hypothetical protein